LISKELIEENKCLPLTPSTFLEEILADKPIKSELK